MTNCKEKEFFRYYKLHLDAPCSFWSTQQICGSHVEGGCEICECDENQVLLLSNKVPLSLRRLPEVLPTAATEANWLQQARWEWPWTVGAEGGTSGLTAAVWVDLHLTVEGNTGYDGSKVWEAIYQENCLPAIEGGSCMEDYLLYRLVSGLHSSITTHIGMQWAKGQHNKEILAKVASNPIYLENLHFTFIFLLKALHKAGPQLRDQAWQTGNQSATQVLDLLEHLLALPFVCEPQLRFDPLSTLAEKAQVLGQLHTSIMNITRLTDCIECEKCRVWSKVQFRGLLAALKVFLAPDSSLTREEVVALVNTLRQLSESVKWNKLVREVDLAPPTQPVKSSHMNVANLGISATIVAVGLLSIYFWLQRKVDHPKN